MAESMPKRDKTYVGVDVAPTKEHPLPYDTRDTETGSWLEELAVAGKTAELQEALGALPDFEARDSIETAALLKNAINKKDRQSLAAPGVALGAAAFLREYGRALAIDANQVRAAITQKLMEIAVCGDTKYELKALELLGKHVDIGLFSTKSEVTVNYKNPDDLENAIKERVKRLLNGDVVDVVPYDIDLDAELGVIGNHTDEDEDDDDLSV
ncbi:MAG: hypothetical protein DDT25_00138 [Chloroflexi bacterium]|nr:hypothetical protein [Chloroflexota bacterium]